MVKLALAVVVCVLAVWTIAEVNGAAPASAPAPSVDCSTLILSMADCLTFVTNGSTIKKPEGGCCSGLKKVLKTNAECLCEALKSSAQFGVVLNITKAAALPSACGVNAPPISNCGLSGAPGPAPGHAPTSSAPTTTPGTPAGAPSGGPSGVPATSPGPAQPKSGVVCLSSSYVAVVSLVVVSYSFF